MTDEQQPKPSEPKRMHPGLQWTLRVVLVAGGTWLLWNADRAAHLASVVTVVVPVGTFYIAALEPKILNLIVQRLRWAYETRIWKPKKGGPNSTVSNGPAKPARQAKAAAVMQGKALPKPSSRFSWQRLQANWQLWVVLLAVAGMLILAAIIGRSSGRVIASQAAPPVDPIESQPIEPEPPPEKFIESPPAEAVASQSLVTVRVGDTCYEIAAACTGDAERFVELGPPLNEGLDVSNRSLCLIRPGDRLQLPEGWPIECAD